MPRTARAGPSAGRPDWWQDGVVYQVYPRSFSDSDGDGVGDLAGLIDHLDYLNDGTPDSLGIDAIWLSPIYPSPGFDLGYDVSDYTGIDPLFGSLADFDRLVVEAHRRGMRVILDQVFNHTSSIHPWFIESRAARSGSAQRLVHLARPGRLSARTAGRAGRTTGPRSSAGRPGPGTRPAGSSTCTRSCPSSPT